MAKKIICLFCAVLFFSLGMREKANAYEQGWQQYNRILFVVDCSNSMNYQDQEKLVAEVMKMFVDGVYSQETQIGFIAYNDVILDSRPFGPVNTIEARNSIKNQIDNMPRRGNTDIGLALAAGMDMLLQQQDGYRPVMILFSDGDTDLTYSNTGRTLAQSTQDEENAVRQAAEIGCPIYTVGISRDGSLNTAYLQEIAAATGGVHYNIQDSDRLLELFTTLFTEITGREAQVGAILTGSGQEQSVSLQIPSQYIEETNIIIQHSGNVGEVKTQYNASDMNLYNAGHYTAIKLTNPLQDQLQLQLTVPQGQMAKVNVIHFMGVGPEVILSEDIHLGQVPVTVQYRSKKDGAMISAAEYYNGMACELTITDAASGEKTTLSMENTGVSFQALLDNSVPAAKYLQATVRGSEYEERSAEIQVDFDNNIPVLKQAEPLRLLKGRKITLDLTQFFQDPDGDTLTFSLLDNPSGGGQMEESQLTFTSRVTGPVVLEVSDGRGGVLQEEIAVVAVPFWRYYARQIIGISSIFILLCALYFVYRAKNQNTEVQPLPRKPKHRFNGARFEGYFLHTLSGRDVPVLYWNSSYIDYRNTVSLGDLLAMMDVKEKLMESYKIYFDASGNQSLLFHHDTLCTVTIRGKDVGPGQKVSLQFDDKIYILFEDGATELEIRYKREKKKAAAV